MTIDAIAVGDSLPPLTFPLDASAIVAGAIATNDFEDVHHDKAAAEAAGLPDVFMNILTTNGLVQRFVTDWAGPAARIRGVEIKLGAPNIAGDTMEMTGKVVRVENDEVDVAVSGRNAMGEHVGATVTIALGAAA